FLDPALLSQADYGRLQLLEVPAQVLIAVGGLGLAHGLLKFLHDGAFADQRDALPFTTLVGTLALAGVLFGLTWGLARPLAAFLVDDPEAVAPVRLTGAYVALKLVGLVPFTVLRAGEQAGRYALAAVGEAVLLVVAVAYFLAVRDAGLVGVMAGFVVSAAGAALLLTALMLRRVPRRVERRLLGPLFRFGAPMAAAALASLALNAGDRLVLKAFTDAEVVAVYGLAAKYGGLVNMLFVQSF